MAGPCGEAQHTAAALSGGVRTRGIWSNVRAASPLDPLPMSHPILRRLGVVAFAAAFASSPLLAAPQGGGVRQLEARYQKQLDGLRAEIERAAPKVRSKQKQAFVKARADEEQAVAALAAAKQELGKVGTARALVGHAKGKWIGGADRGIAQAQAALEKAKTGAERKKAQAELEKWQQNRREGEQALKERQAALDRALKEQPKLEKAAKRAESNLKRAQAAVAKSLKRLGLTSKLQRATLDRRLAKFVVLKEATPRGLATFAEQGADRQQLVDRLLGDDALMLQMVIADGAKKGAYGRAMEIYSQILEKDRSAGKGALQRLALAIALEHAVPIAQRNAQGADGAPAQVDPIARFCHYRDAFAAGELDPGFGALTVWELRMVVDGEEPDEILAWGREMLRSYRPDHVYTKDERWRYVAAVRTDVRYGSQDNKHDRSDLQFFQNILMNGGVCGRRAFFGRFVLRAFGVPTTARPQRGHAALVHRTSKGWVACLGGGWGSGWTKTRYDRDLDFLATTQARRDRAQFLQVKRAQWLGDVFGEKPVYGLSRGKPGFWYAVSLYRQRQVIERSKQKALAPVGSELGEAEDARNRYRVEAAEVTEEDRRIVVADDGTITIPAVACSSPNRSGGKVVFLPSNLGGKQLHYSRNGRGKDIEYTFEAPTAGTYELSLRVVTPSWQQRLEVFANGAKKPVGLPLPNTVGLWAKTDPVTVELAAGRNVLRLRHKSDGYAKGFSVRDLTLKPVQR